MEPFEDFKVKMWKICLSVCLKMMWLHTYVLRGESARVDQFIMLIKARTKLTGFFFLSHLSNSCNGSEFEIRPGEPEYLLK